MMEKITPPLNNQARKIEILPARKQNSEDLSFKETIARAKVQLLNIDSYLSSSKYGKDNQRSILKELLYMGYDLDLVSVNMAEFDSYAIHVYYVNGRRIVSLLDKKIVWEELFGAITPVGAYLHQ
jgi:hypothetical protein